MGWTGVICPAVWEGVGASRIYPFIVYVVSNLEYVL